MLSANLTALLRNPETPQWALRDAIQEEEPTVAVVYVVFGTTGEYSDYRTWTVAAFIDPNEAEARVAAMNAWLKDRNVHRDSEAVAGYEERVALVNTLDPAFQCDYTGSEYHVSPVKLEG